MAVRHIIPFDSLALRVVASELRASLGGARVQDVRQPTHTSVYVALRQPGQTMVLCLSVDVQFPSAHLVRRLPHEGIAPTAFCSALRRALNGSRVTALTQRDFDRVLEVNFESGQPGAGYKLVVEFIDRHANIALLDMGGIVCDAIRRVSGRDGRTRMFLPNQPYEQPPRLAGKLDPFALNAAEHAVALARQHATEDEPGLARELVRVFAGISPFLAAEIGHRAAAGGGDPAAGIANAWDSVVGVVSRGPAKVVLARDATGAAVGAYPVPITHLRELSLEPFATLNAALAVAYESAMASADLETQRAALRAGVAAARKRYMRQRASAERTLAESCRAEAYRKSGELLAANTSQVARGATGVDLHDFSVDPPCVRNVPLDPMLNVRQNAEAYFRRYRKARDGAVVARERLAQADRALGELTVAEETLTATVGIAQLQTLRDELDTGGLLDGMRRVKAAATPGSTEALLRGRNVRRYTGPLGYEILLGATATGNDFLTTRVAKPDDIWLHVRAAASAHVVIRTGGRPAAVPPPVLEFAARLCAQHSVQKHSGLVSVDYTLRKFVRKPRGANAGAVRIEREKTIDVTP